MIFDCEIRENISIILPWRISNVVRNLQMMKGQNIMAQFSVKSNSLQDIINIEERLAGNLDRIGEEIHNVSRSLGFQIAAKEDISRQLRDAADSAAACWSGMNGMASALQGVCSKYENSENTIIANLNGGNAEVQGVGSGGGGGGGGRGIPSEANGFPEWMEWLWKGVGVFGGGGKLVGAIGKFVTSNDSTAAKWADLVSDVNKSGWKIADAIKLSKKEPEIAWWRSVFGFNKNSFLESIGESTLNWQQKAQHGWDYGIKHTLREFKTTKGQIKQGAGILLSLVTNGISNYEDYKKGEMSEGRAVVETVSETVVDWGKDLLIGAGVTAAFAAVGFAAPVVVVGGATVAISAGADWVCEKVCGKKVTEAVSDLVLDTGEKALNAVGDWIGDGAKAVKEGAEAAWNGITKGVGSFFNGITKGFGKPAFA